MAIRSAVSKAQVAGHQDAIAQLLDIMRMLQIEAGNRDASAARGGTLYSSSTDVSALWTRKGLLDAAAVLRKAAAASKHQLEKFAEGPCPACQRIQSRHCEGCGGCPDMQIVPGGTGHLINECPVLVESRKKRQPVPA